MTWHSARRPLGLLASAAVVGLVATVSLAPTDRISYAAPEPLHPAEQAYVQSVRVSSDARLSTLPAESFAAETGMETIIGTGTNESWARLVLHFGDWPQTDENVAFMMRWMRQENGVDNWWNRNNPLNNGYGSGGGSGLGSYANLVDAADYAARNLLARYPAVVAGLETGTDAQVTAAAIWASPWATSHYGYGTMWSTSPVTIVEAPASAW